VEEQPRPQVDKRENIRKRGGVTPVSSTLEGWETLEMSKKDVLRRKPTVDMLVHRTRKPSGA